MKNLINTPARAVLAALSLCAMPVLAAELPAAEPLPFNEPAHAAFETRLRTDLAPIAASIRDLKVLYLSADLGLWLDTGLTLKPGERVTTISAGTVWLSRQYRLGLDQPLAAWARIGASGPVFHGARHTDTFSADRAGPLQLKTFPTRWLSRSGRYAPEPPALNPDGGGGVSVVVIRWREGVDPAQALATLTKGGAAPDWAAAELARLRAPTPAPSGWTYLWELGAADIFTAVENAEDGGPQRRIDAHTRADVAILQTPVDVALKPATRLNWRWKIDQLPAPVSETSPATHDYLSIAVEFDNGRDLTYFWSRDLAPGTHFHCPLEAWKDRETHVVARSGSTELGQWLAESKPILDDYARAVGGPPPKRIVRVWLIANSVFQRREGHGQFGDIVLEDGARRVAVW